MPNLPDAPSPSRACGLAGLDEESRREYWAALALRSTAGLGLFGACRLLRHFGSAWDAVDHVRDWPEAGFDRRLADAFLSNAWRRKARPEWEAARTLKACIILWTDSRYPRLLRELDNAPALLYAAGDTSLLNAPCVAVVGSRNASQAALDFVSRTSEELSAAGVTVASGMAFGIDARAGRAALRQPGRTIAVLGSGVDVPYPACHRELYEHIASGGLVISEAPPGMKPHQGSFPARNRIVSGLSLGVLVAEASSVKSGSLITARLAAEQGRSVYVPAPEALRGPYREGTKQLLLDGARPVSCAGDMLADLFPHLKHALGEKPGRPAGLCSTKDASPAPSADAPAALPAGPAESERACQPLGEETPAASPRDDRESLHQPSRYAAESCPASEKDASPAAGAKACPAGTKKSRPALTPDEDALLRLLEGEPLSPDDLLLAAQAEGGGWTAARAMGTLMILEVKRLVRRLSDSRYEAC